MPTITNQKPVVLTPGYTDNINKDFDAVDIIKQFLVKPLFTPLIANTAVKMTGPNGTTLTEDDIAALFMRCCGEVIDVDAEQDAKDLLGQSLIHFNKATKLAVTELFAVQSGTAAKLPEPDSYVYYTPAADVIPNCRQFIAGTCSFDTFFASLAYYARPETLGFYFVNEFAFDQFIQWFNNQMTMLGTVLTPDVNRMCADFGQLTLKGLTESLILRNNDGDGLDPLSFPRLIVNLLMQYTSVAGPAEFGILPFNVGELVCPRTVVFVNVEKHARATAHQVADEWKLIRDSIAVNHKVQMISNKKLQRLTATQRNLKRIAGQAANAAMNQGAQAALSGYVKFSKNRPHNIDIAHRIKKIMDNMAYVNTSMNTYKETKPSFAKPNRRNPDDFNKQGKITSTRYKPDIHLYIDTSGSISEEDYENAVKACISMAKRLNVNMYFNSFSHIMSQTTRLHLSGKSTKQIYAEFQTVKKVTGGTDYEQIWNFINASKKRTRELSIIISDFEWTARTGMVHHPKNLYYIPCSTIAWDEIIREAERFCQSAVHCEPNIRKHLLF